MKHAEFLRCIKSFEAMHKAWERLASSSSHLGLAGFARRQAEMYLSLHEDTRALYVKVGEPHFTIASDHMELVQYVRQFRERELAWLNRLAYGAGTGNVHI